MKRALFVAAFAALAACAPAPARRTEIVRHQIELEKKPAPPPREAPPPPSPPPAPAPPPSPRGMVLAYRSGDYHSVVEEFERIQEDYPAHLKGPDDLYILGMSHYYLEDDSKALRSFLEFQYRFPDDPRTAEVHLVTARVFRRLGKSDRALDSLRQAIHLAVDEAVRVAAWEEKADILAGEGRYLESLGVLDEAYRKVATGEMDRILTRIRELLAVMPSDMIARSVVGRRWSFPHREAEVILAAREAVAPQPEAAVSETPAETAAPVPAAGEPGEVPVYRIGVMAPATGRMEAYGRELRQGVELLIEESALEGLPFAVEAIYADEGAEADEGELLAAMVASGGVVALVGPLLSSTVERILPVAEASSLAVISPTASSPRLNGVSPNFFRNCFTLEQYGESLAWLAMEVLGLRRFAIFAPDDVYGQGSAAAFREEVLARGGEIVVEKGFDPGLTDFARPIGALKSGAGIPDPLPEEALEKGEYELPFDGLFIPGYAESVGLVLPQLAFHDVDVKRVAVIGGSGLNSPRLAEIGEEYAEGAFFADGFFSGSPRMKVQRFVARYRARYGEAPGTFAAQAYDAAAMILYALGRGAVEPAGVLAALGEMEDFGGVTGEISLRPGGYLQRYPFFGTVARGRLVSLETTALP